MTRRTRSEIYTQLINEKNSQPSLSALQPSIDDEQTLLSDLTTPSRVADWRVWLFIMSVAIWIHEGIIELFEQEIEDIVSKAAPGTAPWIQDKVFKFQYDSGTAQIAKLIDFVVTYPVVDAAKRIVSRCSVKTYPNRIVKIKVAKGATPGALSSPEIDALSSYVELLLPAGVKANIISGASDKLYLNADIYFDGQYAGVIQATVIAALDSFLANFSLNDFDGQLHVVNIVDAIQAVPGVKDVKINSIKARDNGTVLASAYVVDRYWNSVAGYIIQETTAGNTFTDTLTFIPQ